MKFANALVVVILNLALWLTLAGSIWLGIITAAWLDTVAPYSVAVVGGIFAGTSVVAFLGVLLWGGGEGGSNLGS